MNREQVQKIYTQYSSIYDWVFAPLFYPRIKMGLDRSGIQEGDRVLEVGVGTGISLSLYPDTCSVVGVDLTRKMLEKAWDKKRRKALKNIDLVEMDAENLTFADDSFDHSVAAFVVTVVPNPEKMVGEMKRVTKKNGSIVILNHFCSDNGLVMRLEKLFSPLCERWGWRSDVGVEVLSNHCNLQIKEVFKKTRLDPWSIVIAKNNK